MVIIRLCFRLIFCCCLACFSIKGWTLTATANVDRNEVQLNESLLLTVRIDDTGNYEIEGLDKLAADFHLFGNRRNSRVAYDNGRSSSITEWQISLQPKREGLLIIPSLTIDNSRTAPISVQVKRPDPAVNNTAKAYIQASVSADTVWLQQELLLTLRIFHRVALDDLNISGIELADAEIKQLDQSSYRRQIGAYNYQVHELVYGIYPQQTGQLIIPEVVFTAVEPDRRRSVFSMPGQGKPLRKMSQQIAVTVNAPPAEFSGKHWLAAEQLSINENWSEQITELYVGDSLTRTIEVTAKGVLPQQIPPMEPPAIDNAKVYPDQSSQSALEARDGITSVRSDSMAIIATSPGTLSLPAYQVHWWNTLTNTLEVTEVPARAVTVLPATAAATQTTGSAAESDSNPTAITDTAKATTEVWQGWPWLTALMALGWLLTACWAGYNFSNNKASGNHERPHKQRSVSARTARQRVKQACDTNNSEQAMSALLGWCRICRPQQTFHCLADLQQFSTDPEWHQALRQLESSRYHHQAQAWQGQLLWQAVNKLDQQSIDKGNAEQLAPLYRSH